MKNKLGATVRSIEKRKVSVFPAVECCDTCKRYTENRCIHTRPSPLRFKEVFEVWAEKMGAYMAVPNFVITDNNQLCLWQKKLHISD